jgi:hypothetical protein
MKVKNPCGGLRAGRPTVTDASYRQTEIYIFARKNKINRIIVEKIFAFCGIACYTIWAL